MGRGSKTPDKKVEKEAPRFKAVSDGIGNNSSAESRDGCLFTFNSTILLTESSSIKTGDRITLVPEFSDSTMIQVWSGSNLLGDYVGSYYSRILNCAKKGFVYQGEVTEIKSKRAGVEVDYVVSGHLRDTD